jgi:DHA2 family multidrug resistance protein-like MFS transporter
VYRSHLALTGLPAAAADAAKSSVAAGVGVAHQLNSVPLLGSVRHAFVSGMDTMLWICAGIALVSAVLAVIFLPRRPEGGTDRAPIPAGTDVVRGESVPERAELEA